jgi:microcompartment protein CcmK/EutM
VSAMRSSPVALALVTALAALAACGERDVETTPFRIGATLGGVPIEGGLTEARLFVLNGTAAVTAPARLEVAATIDDAGAVLGDLVLTFDGTAAREVAFPAQLDGVAVRVTLLADPAHTGPRGEPLAIPGFRIATGTSPAFPHQFLLYEGTYADATGLADVGAPEAPVSSDQSTPDIPRLFVDDVLTTFEPAPCGLVYYDLLQVQDAYDGDPNSPDDGMLGRGERQQLSTGDPAQPPWTVLHVLSWHRDGRCAGQAQAWTQFAAWRPVPASAP